MSFRMTHVHNCVKLQSGTWKLYHNISRALLFSRTKITEQVLDVKIALKSYLHNCHVVNAANKRQLNSKLIIILKTHVTLRPSKHSFKYIYSS